MELREIAATLWKWLWLIVLATAVAAVFSWFAVKEQPPIYETSTTLMIGQTIQKVSPNYAEFYTSERLAQTYSELIQREPVLKSTAAALGFEGQWRDLRHQVSVNLVPGTELIEILVTDTDPERAKQIADEIARQLMATVEQAGPQRDYRQFIQEQVATLPPKIQAAQEEIGRLEAELAQTSSARQIQDMQNRINTLEKQINDWQATFAQYQLLLGDTGVNVLTVIEEAPLPTEPVGLSWMIQVALAAAIGMVLAVGAAFLIEYLDDALQSTEDLEKATGLTVLGAISRIPGDDISEMLITAHQPKSHISEAYRVLRTNLLFSSPDRPLHSVLVTSPDVLEGKSTMAANLAVVMAQDGKSVVLVDADLRRPILHTIFQLPNQQGLTSTLLDGESVPDGRLQDTEVENLQVLTTGPLPPNPSELLGSQSMHHIIERLGKKVDVILFDTPPVLLVTDAAVLAPRVDGVLMVVEAGQTRQGAVRRATENLRNVGANLLGAALNRIPIRGRGGYYYYYRDYLTDEAGHRLQRRKRFHHRFPLLSRLARSKENRTPR
jgi:succinoglycan biosynthesis transport protein ExoP